MILGPPPAVPALIMPAACTVPLVPIVLPSAQEVEQARQSLAGYTPARRAEIQQAIEARHFQPPPLPPDMQRQLDQDRADADAAVGRYESAARLPDAYRTPPALPAPPAPSTSQVANSTLPEISADCFAALPSVPAPIAPPAPVGPAPVAPPLPSVTVGPVAARQPAAPPPSSGSTSGPQALLHFAAQQNFSGGTYAPASAGFNLADVASIGALNSLPAGVMGLVWLGGSVNGADGAFQAAVNQYIENPKLFGFYIADEPTPPGWSWGTPATVSNLKAEADYIHAHVPGAQVFVVAANLGSLTQPRYTNYINKANTGIDLFGLDPYPLASNMPGGSDVGVIPAAVQAAEAAGIPQSAIVPVYQTFGGLFQGTNVTMPSQLQEQQMLAAWGAAVPTPVFDYAFSWGPAQSGAASLSTSSDLQSVFRQHNNPN